MGWLPTDLLWRSALAVIPLALLVAVVCRLVPCRPSTRHALWLVVLVLLVAAPLVPRATLPALDSVLPVASGPDVAASNVRPPASVTPGPRTAPPSTALWPPSGGPIDVPPPSIASVTPHAELPARVPPPEVEVLQPPAWPPSRMSAAAPSGSPESIDRSGGAAGPPLIEPSGKGGKTVQRTLAGARPQRPALPLATPGAAPKAQESRAGAPREAAATRASGGGATGTWRQWVAQWTVVRNAVMSLPPIPAQIWIGGIALLCAVAGVRISRSMRLVSAGRAAPPSVVRMVAAASKELGLRRPPVTLMVEQPISPMLWCGRQVCIILPRRLWRQLDDVGRRAVIYHELAHLRRRDHLLCWVEMIIGSIYWWHPVVWWIRRRLREEADLCCDAWVTTLMPTGRRAYAQALLETRKYSSFSPHPTVPSVGLGVMTARARRFARRLTMVMTEQTSPSLSRKGVMLACCVALGGLLTTPVWACPPAPQDPCCKPKRVAKPAKPRKPYTLVVPSAPRPPEAPDTTYERFMRDRDRHDRGEMSIEERIEDLERQLERLYQRLEELQRELPRLGAIWGPGVLAAPAPVPATPLQWQPVVAPVAIGAGTSSGKGDCLSAGASRGGPAVVRTYKLPEGKLKALTELMVRSDVPIRVRPVDEGIEVHATAQQQCIFELFCTMIDGEDRVEEYALPEGKLAALTELMVRSDVPILVEPRCEDIKVHGTDLDQLVFGAFVRMIHPGTTYEAQSGRTAETYASALANLADEYESKANVQMAELQGLRAAMRSLQQQARQLGRQAERLHDRAHRLEEKADEYQDKADALEDEADELEGARRQNALAKAEALRAKAEGLRDQFEALHEQSEQIEEQAEALHEEAEELEEQIEELEGEDDDEDDDDEDEHEYDEDDDEEDDDDD